MNHPAYDPEMGEALAAGSSLEVSAEGSSGLLRLGFCSTAPGRAGSHAACKGGEHHCARRGPAKCEAKAVTT